MKNPFENKDMDTEYKDGGWGRNYCSPNLRRGQCHSAPATSGVLLQDSDGEWMGPEEERRSTH